MTLEEAVRTAKRNKENYLAAKAAYNAGDIDGCVAYYAPDHQIMSKPCPKGREHIRRFFEETHAMWPGIRVDVQEVLAEGDMVMARSVSTATHSQPVMGMAPTGKTVEAAFWDLHRFGEDGLIIQTWNLMDSAAILAQLGLLKGL